MVQIVAEWLAPKLREPAYALGLNADGTLLETDGQTLQTNRWDQGWPRLQSIVYTAPDPHTPDHLWITEIGLRQVNPDSATESTVLLSSHDDGPHLVDPIYPLRQNLVPDLLRYCTSAQDAPGYDLRELTESNAPDLLAMIESTERDYPIVLLGPTTRPYVDAQHLQMTLGGIAAVVSMAADADPNRIGSILGDRFASTRSAVNLIDPIISRVDLNHPDQRPDRVHIPMQGYTLEELRSLAEAVAAPPEDELYALVARHVNTRNSLRHISREQVVEHKQRSEFRARKLEALRKGETRQYVALLEEENQELNIKCQRLTQALCDERATSRSTLDTLRDENSQLRSQIENLNASLHYDRAQAANDALSEAVRAAFVRCGKGEADLEDVLTLVETFFRDRVIVLDEAFDSARESRLFKAPSEALRLLIELATRYWEAVVYGNGDTDAREIFGQAYAARESEMVENNRRARDLRTRRYKGENIIMHKHLKIGVKDSLRDTLRIHFYWDADDQMIVIGHCGKHLDHN
ncbi:MAG: hypothetical protein GYB67_00325 [Chloroflexi bacterium]|nr:hypothetical protein [Chloroflexota bacterium]